MQPLIIDNPRIIELAQRAARKRNGTVEEALIDVLSSDVTDTSLDLPDADTLAATYGLDTDIAREVIDQARRREWSKAMVDAEIEWQQRVRDHPDAIRRRLPGFVEHMLRINHWPEHVRATFRTTTDIEDDMYDEAGLPR